MARKKNPEPYNMMTAALGDIVIARSSAWLNGRQRVAAVVTRLDTDPGLVPEGAIAVVALTAFPPGAPSRLMQDVPLYPSEPAAGVLPAAWIKDKC